MVVTGCQLLMTVPMIDPASGFYQNPVVLNCSCVWNWSWCIFPFLQQLLRAKKTPKKTMKASKQDGSLITVTSLDQCCFLSSRLLPAWWCEPRLSSSLILLRSTWPHCDARAAASPHWLLRSSPAWPAPYQRCRAQHPPPQGSPWWNKPEEEEEENLSMNGNRERGNEPGRWQSDTRQIFTASTLKKNKELMLLLFGLSLLCLRCGYHLWLYTWPLMHL